MSTIIEAFEDKIKQDKLDQRRTTLSDIDQAFVDAVAVVAEAEEQELQPSVQRIVSEEIETEAEPEEEEETEADGPDRIDPKATNDELKAWMDEREIDYDSDDKKADLNEKINAWVDAQGE